MGKLDNVKIQTPNLGKTKLDLSCEHVTSCDFMRLQPVYYRHMLPGEKIHIDYNMFTRLAPMAVPTYGSIRMNLRAFAVPFRTLMPNFNQFITNTIANNAASSSLVNVTPTVTNDALVQLLTNVDFSLVSTSTNYDFVRTQSGSSPAYYLFTRLGQYAYKILLSLGYQVDFDLDNNTQYSALPILAFMKVYLDWYSASAYIDTNTMQTLSQLLEYDTPSSYLNLAYLKLVDIFKFVYSVCYDNDYLNACWDNPVAPSNGEYSSLFFIDITNASSNTVVANTGNDGTPEMVSPNGRISGYALDALHALQDYTVRHRMVGARAVDRYLADFGINLSSDKMRRCYYVGSSVEDIQVGDVMSHADTGSGISNLGDYAGRGQGAGKNSFDYETDEFCIFMICASILPTAGYVQGVDRNLYHITRDQFFDHNFDNLGVQMTTKSEVFVPQNGAFYAGDPNTYVSKFGFSPRYSEYKTGRNWLSGVYTLNHLKGMDSWHLFRIFTGGSSTSSFPTANDVVHSLSFVRGDDASQYQRIFNDTKSDIDKFMCVFNFGVTAYAPCRSLFDTYRFHEDDGSKSLTIEANGSKVN